MKNVLKVAGSCFVKTMLSIAAVVSIFWLGAAIKDNWNVIESAWYWSLYTISFGGDFWWGVGASLSGIALFMWSFCVLCTAFPASKNDKSPPNPSKAERMSFFIFIALFFVGGLVWFGGLMSARSIVGDEELGSAYREVSYFIIHIPAILLVLGFVTFIANAVNNARS